jgi:peptidoglycan/LPS O-acetylase OafA/YrhL
MNHFWSLAVEEQFYMVWPLLVAFLSREKMARLCVVLIVIAVVLRCAFMSSGYWLAAYALMPCRMDELAAGGFVALVLRGPTDEQRILRTARLALWPALIVSVAILFAGDFLTAEVLPQTRAFLPSALAVVFGSLHVFATRGPSGTALRRLLELRFLRTFGQYSYGLYVLHHPLRQVFEKLFRPTKLASMLHSPALAVLVFTALAGALSLGLAYVSFRFFESPLLALKRYFEYGRSRPAPDAVTAEVPEAGR